MLVFFGTLSYVCLIWRQYSHRMETLQSFHRWRPPGEIEAPVQQLRPARRQSAIRRRPRLPRITKAPTTTPEPAPTLPIEKLREKAELYETQIVSQLRKAIVDTGKAVEMGEVSNVYHVKANVSRANYLRISEDARQLACSALAKTRIQTFRRGDPFFREQQLDEFLMSHDLLQGRYFNKCGVVPSSGSLLNSNLGTHIDANDFVIRFNNAPTRGFTQDVGDKTSLRIVNSQVVGKPEFHFLDSNDDLYSASPVLVWDPSGYGAAIRDWYANPDYPFFETFFSKRLMRPEEELHLLDPRTLWHIWEWMQTRTKPPLLPNPPSSGFLGILLAMHHCQVVHVYEFIPSMRLTKRCHYYDNEENFGCTIGDWHPLAAEKLLALAMNVGEKLQVFSEGFITITGFGKLSCQS